MSLETRKTEKAPVADLLRDSVGDAVVRRRWASHHPHQLSGLFLTLISFL